MLETQSSPFQTEAGPQDGPEEADVIVLGGGIVGVSIAVHLQMRGRNTVLVDRQGPGEGTSFGNAGLIQREAVFPHLFPRNLGDLLRYATNRSTDAYYHPAMLPRLLRPFLGYWQNSEQGRYRTIAHAYAQLIAHCVDDHVALAEAAGAMDLLRPGGWTQAHEDPKVLAAALAEAEVMRREYGVEHVAMDSAALARHEPHIRSGLAGGLHWTQPVGVIDPHALTLAYTALFERLGGRVRFGNARTLTRAGAAWRVTGAGGAIAAPISAPEVVIALGAFAPDVTKPLGYAPPLFVKRGYHMHYQPDVTKAGGNALLTGPVLDVANGYMLIPMRRGIRLTTGAEFAHRDAEPTPVQLARAEPAARRLLPGLGTRMDAEPWMGARPCTPDMLPIIGAAPGQKGAWYAFGHAHQGLTLGPTTGRLLAAMMTGDTPFTDPTPYRPERF
ncbi:NAD(P)/FAD-dependent oxidoreductase [Acidisoma cladoniae]|uniref:NAD(P)/FAD-dependent oxidoreductase n=1 Tax=Acidisoma cladoniae TaxID=3040935 RepID=UPI00254F4E35|nr:FAD-binding oxidoreductase [Acidisoma sp. PAMC 29798]